MTHEVFELVDAVESEICKLDVIHTVLSEMSYDLEKVITFDGSEEDNQRQANLLNRRPVLNDFLYIAMDTIFDVSKKLQSIVKSSYGGGGG